jgi:hypothetical protein
MATRAKIWRGDFRIDTAAGHCTGRAFMETVVITPPPLNAGHLRPNFRQRATETKIYRYPTRFSLGASRG